MNFAEVVQIPDALLSSAAQPGVHYPPYNEEESYKRGEKVSLAQVRQGKGVKSHHSAARIKNQQLECLPVVEVVHILLTLAPVHYRLSEGALTL